MAEAYICRSGYQRYCVGDIFITTRAGNPSTLLGYGTWQQIKDRFLLAAGDSYAAGNTGGEAEHTLTIQEMPNHRHGGVPANVYRTTSYIQGQDGDLCTGIKGYTDYMGYSQPHNNMPPYLVVNMWIRVA